MCPSKVGTMPHWDLCPERLGSYMPFFPPKHACKSWQNQSHILAFVSKTTRESKWENSKLYSKEDKSTLDPFSAQLARLSFFLQCLLLTHQKKQSLHFLDFFGGGHVLFHLLRVKRFCERCYFSWIHVGKRGERETHLQREALEKEEFSRPDL